MKGIPGTCHYCTNRATQLVVWLKDKKGQPDRIPLPHCGCDPVEALRQFWPSPYPIKQGVDYEIEPLPEDAHHSVSGDGFMVTVKLRDAETGSARWVEATIPKAAARKLAKDILAAAEHPEPGCTDPTDHFRGHCGCR